MTKRKGPRPSISLNEITVQIALGTLTDPYQIAGFITVTEDVNAIVWASKHSSSKVREASAMNMQCPLGVLIKLGLIDVSNRVRNASREALIVRKNDFNAFLFVIEEYPQLALPFYHSSKVKGAEEVPAPAQSASYDEEFSF